ncbi:MOP flippase family protein [Planococcus citreus]|uniref:PST family polysaccharide transporter/teichuronic acid exporter/lipopolysaccharide exporter n=1 Tax=Planococcus citreus TaxID=1373 RepID=A0A497YJ35_9BACL|nr:MOP flippase family protein [Planococcus citreus]RLJ90589.1 PST family polysaccharide transporter/teichuronic acid exporter/lipopolysaccharide exporter [Planococcus citreus]
MASLKTKAVDSVKITGATMAIVGILQLIQLVVLGRVLGAAVFGAIAVIQIVIQFAQMYMDMGITDAIIQKEKISKKELSSLYWFSIGLGTVLFLLMALAAPVIATLFDQPELEGYIRVIGISFAIIPFGAQFQTIATKSLDFKDIGKYEILSNLAGTLVTLTLAIFFSLGAWSLVYGFITMSVFKTVPWAIHGFRDSGTRPHWEFAWGDIQELINFGMYRLAANTANFFNTKIDQIVVGIMLGPQILGYYSMAMNIVMQPIQRLNPMITKVSFPVFSKIQKDRLRLRKAYLFIIKLIMALNAPLYGGLIVLAPYVIPMLLGDGWGEAIPVVQILSLYALFRALGNPSGSLFVAVGKVKWSFYWQLSLLFVVPLVAYLSSLSGSIVLVASAMALLRFVLFFINYWLRIRWIIGPAIAPLLKAIFIPLGYSAVMATVLVVIIASISGIADGRMIVTGTLAGAFVYGGLMLLFERKLLQEVKGMFIKKAEI